VYACLVLLRCRYAWVALQLRPNFGLAHFQTAVCYERLGLLAEALTAAEKALEMSW
jgi:tetratricopeptide (TPR) repeat protein